MLGRGVLFYVQALSGMSFRVYAWGLVVHAYSADYTPTVQPRNEALLARFHAARSLRR